MSHHRYPTRDLHAECQTETVCHWMGEIVVEVTFPHAVRHEN